MKTYKNRKTKIASVGLSLSLLAFFAPSLASATDFASSDLYTISTTNDSSTDGYSFQAYDSDGKLQTYYLNMSDITSGSGTNTVYFKWVDGNLTTADSSGTPWTAEDCDFSASYDAWSAGRTSKSISTDAINYTKAAANGELQGGIAYYSKNSSSPASVEGNFVGNSFTSTSTYVATNGGVISIISTGYVDTLEGDFISNGTYETTGTGQGGVIYNAGTISADTVSSFIANYVTATDSGTAKGGAVCNVATISGSWTGDFIGNYVSAVSDARGGAIYNSSTFNSVEGNFINNTATITSGTSYGGAVFNAEAGSITFTASEGKSYSYLGNSAGTSAENGGFLYNNGGTVNFSVGTRASIIIGSSTYDDYYDSIAGSGSIAKSGAGTLIVNSSMQYYTGSLSVEAGTMTINNSLGSTVISITQGASLYAKDLAESITLSVYLSSGSSSAEMFSTLDSVIIDALSIYLTVDSVEGDSIVVYDSSDITVGSVVVYDTDGVTELDSDLYTFNAGTFTYGTAAVPEPSTYAMIFGVVALGFAAYRRRK